MATNYVNEGTRMTITAGADISSGDVVVQGSTLGIAVTNIANGASGEIMIEGTFDLPKADAAVITAGEGVIWDSSAGEFDDDQATPASGDVSGAAIAMESKGATTGETIKVKLGRVAGTVTP